MMKKNIEISLNLYERLGTLAEPFETPEDVITRILNSSKFIEVRGPTIETKIDENNVSNSVNTYNKLNINFFPSDQMQFKQLLLEKKRAWVRLELKDGSKNIHEWNAFRFNESSDVLGNLRSGYLRNWRKKGIINADIVIDKNDLG